MATDTDLVGTNVLHYHIVERLGGEVGGFTFVLELAFLHGRAKLDGYRVEALVTYE